jgi:hypothetical protein
MAKSYFWRRSVAAGDMTGVKVLSFGSCTDFFKVPVEKALLSKRHKGELTPSQLTDKRNRGLVTDIYPVGYMCRRTISVTRPCEVKIVSPRSSLAHQSPATHCIGLFRRRLTSLFKGGLVVSTGNTAGNWGESCSLSILP